MQDARNPNWPGFVSGDQRNHPLVVERRDSSELTVETR